MPTGPAARILDPVLHVLPGMLMPGPGSFNVFIGKKMAWRGVPLGAVAGMQAAKAASEVRIATAQAATVAAAGTPGLPAVKAAEEALKLAESGAMSASIAGMAGGADLHACVSAVPIPLPPPHGIGVVIDGSPTVLINKLPACRLGDTILEAFGPPNKIIMGEIFVIIGQASNLPPPSSADFARTLVDIGGSATEADAELVIAELGKMPLWMLMDMSRANTRVVVARGSVTDYRADLAGVQPRGWPAGSTWDTVPGAFMPDTNEVVVATVGHGTPAGAHVPATGEGHGSQNLVIHEASHGHDHGGNPPYSSRQGFNDARDADSGNLSAYESQAGEAGQEETYGESAARHYDGDDSATPELHDYWANQ